MTNSGARHMCRAVAQASGKDKQKWAAHLPWMAGGGKKQSEGDDDDDDAHDGDAESEEPKTKKAKKDGGKKLRRC